MRYGLAPDFEVKSEDPLLPIEDPVSLDALINIQQQPNNT